MSKWTWVRDEDQGVWMNGHCETKEGAIRDGRNEIQQENKDFELENREKFYIGKLSKYIPAPPDADLVLERLGDRMCDVFEPDMVEDYLLDISIDDVALLHNKLDKVWNDWMRETENYPNLFEVIEIEEVNVYSGVPGQQKGAEK